MEKKQITGIVCVPTVSNPGDAFKALNRISSMLGNFYCTQLEDAALMKYDGIISSEHKDTLEKIAKEYYFTLMYIEMYEDDDRATDNTINLINNIDVTHG